MVRLGGNAESNIAGTPRVTSFNAPQKPQPTPPKPPSGTEGAWIVISGSAAASGLSAAGAATIGSFIPHAGGWSALGSMVAGAAIGGLAGGAINFKAVEIADRKYPKGSHSSGGYQMFILNTVTSAVSGALAGLSGHYGVSPAVAGGIAGGASGTGLFLLLQAVK